MKKRTKKIKTNADSLVAADISYKMLSRDKSNPPLRLRICLPSVRIQIDILLQLLASAYALASVDRQTGAFADSFLTLVHQVYGFSKRKNGCWYSKNGETPVTLLSGKDD